MNDSHSSRRARISRRQKIVVGTGVTAVVAFYLFQVIPNSLGSGVALFFCAALIVAGLLLALLAKVHSGRKRGRIVTLLALICLAIAFWSIPNFRRSVVQRRLQEMGATVTTETDEGDGVWFRYHGLYLPCWAKTHLGDAFFGRIDTVNFARKPVPIDEIARLNIREPIATLNLGYADISKGDLGRLTTMIDAKQVLLNSLPVDADTLSAFDRMGSLERIVVIDTEVTAQEASSYAAGHPTVVLVHGDVANGYGRIMPRIPGFQSAGP